jgi:hypothetical protein
MRSKSFAGIIREDRPSSLEQGWRQIGEQCLVDDCDGAHAKRSTDSEVCRPPDKGRIVKKGNPSMPETLFSERSLPTHPGRFSSLRLTRFDIGASMRRWKASSTHSKLSGFITACTTPEIKQNEIYSPTSKAFITPTVFIPLSASSARLTWNER